MPLDPAGNYSLIPSYFAEPGTTIRTEQHNPVLEDIASAISQHLVRDGRNGMVGNLDMGTFSIRNLAPGTNPTDAANVSQGVPVGAVMDFAGAAAPANWMLAYGQAVSRTTYAALFAAIGTTYGAGDGSTTFNLPDLRGRVAAGKDNMGGTAAARLTGPVVGSIGGLTLGATGGAESHVLGVHELAKHGHTFVGNPLPPHAHSYDLASNFNVPGFAGYGRGATATVATNAVSAGTPSGVIQDNGSSAAHNNIQPTIVLNKIIKVTN